MNIIDFNQNHIEEAITLAKLNYEDERQFVAFQKAGCQAFCAVTVRGITLSAQKE